jgi:hypothetical protein
VGRKYHYLRGNKGNSLPRDILYLDTETLAEKIDVDRTRHVMDIAWTCLTRKVSKDPLEWSHDWRFWSDRDELCVYIRKCSQGVRALNVICSNVVFDLAAIGFFNKFPKWGYKYEFYFERGMTFILSVTEEIHRIKAMSIQNWFPESVKNIGEYVGLPKIEVDFKESTYEEIKEYCKRDTEILVVAMESYFRFIKDNDLGNFKVSRAAQALTSYRHKFLTKRILFHAETHVAQLERAGYYGGKCEAYFIGELPPGRYLYLDVNSLYPSIMKTRPVPCRLTGYIDFPSNEYIEYKLETKGVIAEVDLKTSHPSYAKKYENHTIFPVGWFTTTLCTEGLKRALKRGDVHRVRRAALYDMDILFTEYIDYFYNMRLKFKQEGNKLYDVTCKYFMNSLYGKFGQMKDVELLREDCDPEELRREEIYNLDTGASGIDQYMFGVYTRFEGKEDTENTFTAIPAHITEYGRFILDDIIERVGRDRVFYCDTDCIIINSCDSVRVRELLDERKLGSLKLEKEANYIKINGAKDYVFGDTTRLKGIKKNAEQVNANTYIQDQWLSLNGLMAEGVQDGFIVKRVEKELTRVYDKGIVQDNGCVTPFDFLSFDPILSYEYLSQRPLLSRVITA